MANYAALARTNYFRVKDRSAFEADLAKYGVLAEFDVDAGVGPQREGMVALTQNTGSGWPSFEEDVIADRLELEHRPDGSWYDANGVAAELPLEHGSIEELVMAHLVDFEVAIFLEVGYEKTRYLGATALAIDAYGKRVSLDLEDIYDMALKQLSNKGSIDIAQD